MSRVCENLEKIRAEIEENARRFGHKPDEVTLVAVTKFVEDEKVLEALEAGVSDVGENRPQEIVRKESLFQGARVHLIGQLQRNKVRTIAGKTTLIHSVDRLSLLQELERIGIRDGVDFSCLIQMNLAQEASKSGIAEEELRPLLDAVEELSRVRVYGLMCMAPEAEDPESVRWVFQKARKIFEQTQKFGYNRSQMKILSMGMSNDFRIALQEGSTMVRIGSAIFGKRVYQ